MATVVPNDVLNNDSPELAALPQLRRRGELVALPQLGLHREGLLLRLLELPLERLGARAQRRADLLERGLGELRLGEREHPAYLSLRRRGEVLPAPVCEGRLRRGGSLLRVQTVDLGEEARLLRTRQK